MKLTAEGQKLEPEIRAALVAEDVVETTITETTDPEQRERLEIRSKTGRAASPLGVQRRERRIERRGKWGGVKPPAWSLTTRRGRDR